MNYLYRQRLKGRLRQEIGTRYKQGALCRLGLVYPNRYFFGMSNLGFQTLYALWNQDPRVSCERIFLPEDDLIGAMGPGDLCTYEQQNFPADLDALAFSISYQNDLLNVIPLLKMMGVETHRERRDSNAPLLLAGGPALTINPEPAAMIFDAIVIGEGEGLTEAIADILCSNQDRDARCQALSQLPGVYVPSRFSNEYTQLEQARKPTRGFGLVSGAANGVPQDFPVIGRQVNLSGNSRLAQSELLTPETEFGDLFLLEVQRGCQWGCRFCAAGFMYRYPRYDSLNHLKGRVDQALQHRNKVGLIAGDLLGHEAIHELLDYIDAKGGAFSPSSVRLNAFTPKIIHHLKKSGNRSIAIAPEAGSERLRRALNKSFTQEEIVNAAVQLAEGGIENIKLYIMIGLPTETEADLAELCDLTLKTREALTRFAKKSARMPALTLSVSPFVPKPSTPLQYEPFAGLKSLKQKFQWIRKRLLSHGHIRLSGESALDAYIETLLSRGDQRVMEFLEAATIPLGKSWQVGSSAHLKTALKNLSFDPGTFTDRPLDPSAPAPWDFLDHGMKKSYYSRELDKFSRGRLTPACQPEICRSCGVC